MMRALFCEECGSLLDPPESTRSEVQCASCGAHVPHATFLKHRVQTVLRTGALGGAGDIDEAEAEAAAKGKNAERALVAEQCERCKHPEMYYYTMQLRSADEGQTVFYECPQCAFKSSTNT
jgi:DNA-directed RNA polymerase I subunit RPA12